MERTGIFRAIIVSNADPERRGRVQVRIDGTHPSNAQDAHLPWAELVSFAGKLHGDFPTFMPGDLAWVMFEANNTDQPVIVGGWISHSSGVNDYPADLADDYANSMLRWRRQDRAGNIFEMDSRPGSNRVYLRSGGVEVEVNGTTGSVKVLSQSSVTVIAPSICAQGDDVSVNANAVTLQARPSTVDDSSTLNLVSLGVVNLYAASAIQLGKLTDSEGDHVTPSINIQSASAITLNTQRATVNATEQVTVNSPQVTVNAEAANVVATQTTINSPTLTLLSPISATLTTPLFKVVGAVVDFGECVEVIPPPS